MLDFSKLLEDTLDTAVVNPIEIFDLLPEKMKSMKSYLGRHNKGYSKLGAMILETIQTQ